MALFVRSLTLFQETANDNTLKCSTQQWFNKSRWILFGEPNEITKINQKRRKTPACPHYHLASDVEREYASKVVSKIIIESSDSDNSSDQNEYVKVKSTCTVKNTRNKEVILNDNKIVTEKDGKYVHNDNDSDEINTDIIDIIHKSVNAYGIPHTHTIRGNKFLLKPVPEGLLINLFTEIPKKRYHTGESI